MGLAEKWGGEEITADDFEVDDSEELVDVE
jgi:hypothetical protein